MNAIARGRAGRAAMTTPNLFDTGTPNNAPGPLSGLYADIVFDRPLDHAFTYAVPQSLVEKIGVGKRVEAPLGRGGKGTSGFCVRVTDTPPSANFEVKTIANVLDDDAL